MLTLGPETVAVSVSMLENLLETSSAARGKKDANHLTLLSRYSRSVITWNKRGQLRVSWRGLDEEQFSLTQKSAENILSWPDKRSHLNVVFQDDSSAALHVRQATSIHKPPRKAERVEKLKGGGRSILVLGRSKR